MKIQDKNGNENLHEIHLDENKTVGILFERHTSINMLCTVWSIGTLKIKSTWQIEVCFDKNFGSHFEQSKIILTSTLSNFCGDNK